MEPEVREAVERSFLSTLPAPTLGRLLARAEMEHIPAGTVTYRAEGEPRAVLIIRGLLRTYVIGPEDREVTIRYARDGDILGVVAVTGQPTPLHVQTLIDSVRLKLDVEALSALIRGDPDVAWALILELTHTVHALWHTVAAAAFASVPQRVALHLLEVAAREQQADSPRLVARMSQEKLAHLVGSVREVVARALRELRDAEIVEVTRAGVVITDAPALAARAWPRPWDHH